jgi:SLOG in TRPM, prokaryote
MTDYAAGASPAKRGSRGLARHTIVFPGGRSASAVVAPTDVSGADAVGALQLEPPRALIVLGGSTNELSPDVATVLRSSIGEGLARVAADERLTVVTGGTDAGIFAIFGQALADQATAPCVGVAPAGAVTWPGRSARELGVPPRNGVVQLEPHHTHFLLVEGAEWGIETEALIALAATLAAECPSVAILAGGGGGARQEVLEQIRRGRQVLVLAGSGRFADELVCATRNGNADATDPRTAEAAASGLVTVLDSPEPPASFAEHVRVRLGLTEAKAKR